MDTQPEGKVYLCMQHGQVEGTIQVHDSPVHDVAYGAETVFVTCSADGTARIVDSRFVP